jgi:hypothetical protein
MRSAHEYDAFGVVEYVLKVYIGVISREQNGSLADKAAQAATDKNEGTG